MNILSRPISFLLLMLGIIAMTVQGNRSRPSLSLLSSLSTSNTNTNTYAYAYTCMHIIQSAKLSPLMRSILKLRGGEDEDNGTDEEEESDDESDDEGDDTPSPAIDYAAILENIVDVSKDKIFPAIVKCSQKTVVTAKKTSVSIYQALHRAICVALEGEDGEETDDSDDEYSDDEEGEEVTTVMDKIIFISKKSVTMIRRMVKAALTVPEDGGSVVEEGEIDEEDDEVTVEPSEEEKEDEIETDSETIEVESMISNSAAAIDFGSYLAEAYGVDDKRNRGKIVGHTIMGGSLQDALQTARQQARMLLVFIPSERPKGERGGLSFFGGGGKKGNAEIDEMDRVAIESLLSYEVGKAANKKARKNQGSEEDLGSFAIWGGKAGSSEATSAIKQLKVKVTSAKGEKRHILCVVYPAIAAVVSISSFSSLQIGRMQF